MKKTKKLTIYVHDLFYEIGHSNVTLFSLRNLPNLEEYDFKFVVFNHAPKEELFPEKDITIHKAPFGWIKPAFLLIIWFHIYAWFYSIIFDRGRTKISLGIANMNCDISILHFVHTQWTPFYYQIHSGFSLKNIYRWFMFNYLNSCEKILFKFFKPKVLSVSKFMLDYVKENFSMELEGDYIHSGFDLNHFGSSNKTNHELIKELAKENNNIEQLDLNKPVVLFVGAFERKGLDKLLRLWREDNSQAQFVVVGKGEIGSDYKLETYERLIHIPFTKKINLYYEIADYLLFPTIYEPFGMVLIEAAVKGIEVYTVKENVGASEVLEGLEGIHFFQRTDDFKLPGDFRKIDQAKRMEYIQERTEKLSRYQWKHISKKYDLFLKKI